MKSGGAEGKPSAPPVIFGGIKHDSGAWHQCHFREPDTYLAEQIYTLELTNYEVYRMFNSLIRKG